MDFRHFWVKFYTTRSTKAVRVLSFVQVLSCKFEASATRSRGALSTRPRTSHTQPCAMRPHARISAEARDRLQCPPRGEECKKRARGDLTETHHQYRTTPHAPLNEASVRHLLCLPVTLTSMVRRAPAARARGQLAPHAAPPCRRHLPPPTPPWRPRRSLRSRRSPAAAAWNAPPPVPPPP